MTKEKGKKGRLHRLRSIFESVYNFFTRRYVWSGLLGGIIWMFAAIFIISSDPGLSSDVFSEELQWVLFFPIKLSSQLTFWIVGENIFDPFILLVATLFISMLVGLTITYSIHRVRVWRKLKRIPNTL